MSDKEREMVDAKCQAYRNYDDTIRDISKQLNDLEFELFRKLEDGEINKQQYNLLKVINRKTLESAAIAAKNRYRNALRIITNEYLGEGES